MPFTLRCVQYILTSILQDQQHMFGVRSSHQMRRCNQLFASGLDTSHYPFHRAALNAGRSNREKGVRPSVRLSFKRVDCEKTEEKSV